MAVVGSRINFPEGVDQPDGTGRKLSHGTAKEPLHAPHTPLVCLAVTGVVAGGVIVKLVGTPAGSADANCEGSSNSTLVSRATDPEINPLADPNVVPL